MQYPSCQYSGVLEDDATLVSTMYFSGEPSAESIIKFNEYDDLKGFQELARERMKVLNEGIETL